MKERVPHAFEARLDQIENSKKPRWAIWERLVPVLSQPCRDEDAARTGHRRPFNLTLKGRLKRRFAAFVVADANGFLDPADEDFSVADAAGPGGADDGLDGSLL